MRVRSTPLRRVWGRCEEGGPDHGPPGPSPDDDHSLHDHGPHDHDHSPRHHDDRPETPAGSPHRAPRALER
ncbi:MAG: hypothetical protein J2P58_04730 [Acidimicrobiaceae bacterium]|nr:hypothetical protein [Acidimicrobiaceae bacterium]